MDNIKIREFNEKMDEKEAETYYECSDFDNNENEKDLIVVNATLGE